MYDHVLRIPVRSVVFQSLREKDGNGTEFQSSDEEDMHGRKGMIGTIIALTYIFFGRKL